MVGSRAEMDFLISFAVVAVVLAATAVQLRALVAMGRRRPIGDEAGYLARGQSADPFAPRLFIRPPLLPWLAALSYRRAGDGESRLRRWMAIASCLTVVLVALTGWRLGGPWVALVASLLLAAQPERIVLGCHIWPEPLLALLLAALCFTQTIPPTPGLALGVGLLATLGVLCRIDFAIVPPVLLAAWWQTASPPTAVVAVLLLPSVIALIWTSTHNYRRYGIPFPDTTWAFNLMVARRESRFRDSNRFEIEAAVNEIIPVWKQLHSTRVVRPGVTAFMDILRSPLRFGRGIGRRLLTLAGPDTFVRQKLLPAEGAYPQLGDRSRRRWDRALRVAFPLLVTIILSSIAVSPRLPESFAWPSLALLAVAVLFHARTRFRVVAMPALALLAALGLVRLAAALPGRPELSGAIAILATLLLWALLRIKCSTEVDTESGEPDLR